MAWSSVVLSAFCGRQPVGFRLFAKKAKKAHPDHDHKTNVWGESQSLSF